MQSWKLVFMGLFLTTGAIAAPVSAYNDGEIVHFTEEVATPREVVDAAERSFRSPGASTFDEDPLILIETIVNLGKELWKVIEENKAVLNVHHTYANALPRGVKSGEDLEGFSSLQYRSFRRYGKNTFGSTVYDVNYTLIHRYGGSVEGRGRYLDTVAVLPHKVSVLWGYKMDLNVSHISTVNVGTKRDPIASLAMEMQFRVETLMKVSEQRSLYEFRGDTADVRIIEPN